MSVTAEEWLGGWLWDLRLQLIIDKLKNRIDRRTRRYTVGNSVRGKERECVRERD